MVQQMEMTQRTGREGTYFYDITIVVVLLLLLLYFLVYKTRVAVKIDFINQCRNFEELACKVCHDDLELEFLKYFDL